ncbi:MAG TPA: hypothetical protein VLZ29_04860 [Sulfurimonas sp.]|uniref:hypothetical protein n=1 Tax=Sulfurimonas sp. TaxID=2022749 RepID=UPI002BC7A455|nr:hypothetical protein [Sulfurimonas sp.]HUH42423.1 hypothetical protein [Sulfurimonas sp.]
MKTILSFIAVIIFITGCSFRTGPKNGKEIEITNEQRIYTQSGSISATAPNNFPKVPYNGYTRFDYDMINFDRRLPNMMSEDVRITVSIPERLKESTEKFLIKNFDYEKWAQDVLDRPDIVANMKERGVTYSKKYVDYIGGLRCGTDVESANIAMGVGHTKYYTVCGYYDTAGAKKRIDIFYNYTYTHRGTKFESDKTSSSISPQAMQMQFKQDMKAIFDSLVIHDMDRKRMEKEGLLHDKKYEINEW